jgi:hypothetical protein
LGRRGAPKRPAIAATPDDPPFLEFWKRAKGTLPETIAEADLNTLNSGLGFLFGRLREAQAEFHEEGDNGRRGAFTALAASWMFITLFRTPFEEELYVPILRLQDALAMLDKNRVEPIVKPARRSGRAPSSNTYLCLKGYAATTVELLLQAGLTRDDACRAVATQLRQLGVRPERGSGPVTAITVRNWRDDVSSDVGRLGIAAMMYDKKLASNKREGFSELPKDQVDNLCLSSALGSWHYSQSCKNLLNPLT